MGMSGKQMNELSGILETVKAVYRTMNGVPPLVFVVGEDSTRFTFPIFTFTERAYVATRDIVKSFVSSCNAELAVTLTQGRYLDVPPGTLVMLTVEERYAFSKEVLFVHYETRAGSHMLHYPVLREGEVVSLGEPVEVDPGIKPDIFFNIF